MSDGKRQNEIVDDHIITKCDNMKDFDGGKAKKDMYRGINVKMTDNE